MKLASSRPVAALLAVLLGSPSPVPAQSTCTPGHHPSLSWQWVRSRLNLSRDGLLVGFVQWDWYQNEYKPRIWNQLGSSMNLGVAGQLPYVTPDGDQVLWKDWISNVSYFYYGPIMLYDVPSGTSTAIYSSPFGNEYLWFVRISDDGSFLDISDRTPSGTVNELYRVDLVTGQHTLLSADSNGNPANQSCGSEGMSDDGLLITLSSRASNLVPGDTNGFNDIFLRDLTAQQTTRISLGPGGVEGNGDSRGGDMSSDGRFVVFTSWASNLVPGDTNGKSDVFIRDLSTGENHLASRPTTGGVSTPRPEGYSISDDGRFVVYRTTWQGSQLEEVYLHDRVKQSTVPVSDGSLQSVGVPALSGDAQMTVYPGSDLVNANEALRTWSGCDPGEPLVYCTSKTNSQGCAASIGFTGTPAPPPERASRSRPRTSSATSSGCSSTERAEPAPCPSAGPAASSASCRRSGTRRSRARVATRRPTTAPGPSGSTSTPTSRAEGPRSRGRSGRVGPVLEPRPRLGDDAAHDRRGGVRDRALSSRRSGSLAAALGGPGGDLGLQLQPELLVLGAGQDVDRLLDRGEALELDLELVVAREQRDHLVPVPDEAAVDVDVGEGGVGLGVDLDVHAAGPGRLAGGLGALAGQEKQRAER